MSLRHGLLGLLAEGPASGYDLATRFQAALGTAWPAQHPRIYAELTRLAADNLIEVDSRGPRGRKAYRITDAGLAEVRHWLADVPVDHSVRIETLFRSFFFWLMEPDDLARHLAAEHEFYAGMAARMRELAAAKDRGDWGTSPPTRALRIAVEAATRLNEALAEWARWTIDTDLMASDTFGKSAAAGGPAGGGEPLGLAGGDD
jgi:DNA-binding PadR family transcriptional regulator